MRFSWSLLRAYEQCPLQQKLIRIDKLGPEKVDERRFIRGSTGHKFLELWAKKGFCNEITPEEAGNIFKGLASKKHIVWLGEKDKEELAIKVISDASMIMEAVRFHKLNLVNDLKVEKWISKPILSGEHVLAGLMDMLAESGRWVIETKMSKDPKWFDKDQLIFYGFLLRVARGKYPARLSFFLPLIEKVENRLVDVDFSEDEFLRMLNRVKRFILKWNTGKFPAMGEADTCRWCDVKSYCPSVTADYKNSLFQKV